MWCNYTEKLEKKYAFLRHFISSVSMFYSWGWTAWLRHLTAEAQVQSQTSPSAVYDKVSLAYVSGSITAQMHLTHVAFICHRCYVISVIDSVIKQTLLSLAQLCLWFISCRCRVPHTKECRSVRWLVWCLLGQVHGTAASSHRLASWQLQQHNDFSPFYCK